MQIISAIVQGDLRQLQAQPDPVSGDVIEVVEVNPAHRDGAERVEAGRWRGDRNSVVLRLIRQGNESDKAARFILQLTQLPQMIDPVGDRFDVTVEHGAGAAPSHLVPGAVDLEVFPGRFLSSGDGRPDFLAKNLRATPGQCVQAGVAQFDERFTD